MFKSELNLLLKVKNCTLNRLCTDCERDRKHPEKSKSDVDCKHLSPLLHMKYFTYSIFSSRTTDALINFTLVVDKCKPYNNLNIILSFLLTILFNIYQHKTTQYDKNHSSQLFVVSLYTSNESLCS